MFERPATRPKLDKAKLPLAIFLIAAPVLAGGAIAQLARRNEHSRAFDHHQIERRAIDLYRQLRLEGGRRRQSEQRAQPVQPSGSGSVTVPNH